MLWGGRTATNVQLFKNDNFTAPHDAIKHYIPHINLRNGRAFYDENCLTEAGGVAKYTQ
jgi:hypothetical protein